MVHSHAWQSDARCWLRSLFLSMSVSPMAAWVPSQPESRWKTQWHLWPIFQSHKLCTPLCSIYHSGQPGFNVVKTTCVRSHWIHLGDWLWLLWTSLSKPLNISSLPSNKKVLGSTCPDRGLISCWYIFGTFFQHHPRSSSLLGLPYNNMATMGTSLDLHTPDSLTIVCWSRKGSKIENSIPQATIDLFKWDTWLRVSQYHHFLGFWNWDLKKGNLREVTPPLMVKVENIKLLHMEELVSGEKECQ